MRRNRGLFVLLGLVLAMVAGCTSDKQPPAQDAEVTHPTDEVPKDRDQDAVVAALRQLDACALLESGSAVPGYPTNVKPTAVSPHTCKVPNESGDEMWVAVGVPYKPLTRFDSEALTVDGTKAYISPYLDSDCHGFLPVSFTLAIEYTVKKGDRSKGSRAPCDVAKDFLKFGVAKLADQDKLRSNRPLAEWDACLLLSTALDNNPNGYKFTFNNQQFGVDRCGADKVRPDDDPSVQLTIEYKRDPTTQARDRVRTVGGKPVLVYEGSSYCEMEWSVGRVPSAGSNESDQVVVVRTPNCKDTEPTVTAVMERLGEKPPEKSVKPQRPLTYRSDEPDMAVVGACVDFNPEASDCRPYVEVSVPSDGTQILRAGEADPNVVCAFTREAVAKHLGAEFKPVTFKVRTKNVPACVLSSRLTRSH